MREGGSERGIITEQRCWCAELIARLTQQHRCFNRSSTSQPQNSISASEVFLRAPAPVLLHSFHKPKSEIQTPVIIMQMFIHVIKPFVILSSTNEQVSYCIFLNVLFNTFVVGQTLSAAKCPLQRYNVCEQRV